MAGGVPTDANANAMDCELLSCSGVRLANKTMVRLEAYCKQLEPLVHAVDLLRVLLHARVELLSLMSTLSSVSSMSLKNPKL